MYNRLLGEQHNFTDDEVWLLGRRFEKQDNFIEKEVQSLVWVSYRKGFAYLPNSSLTSDAGWGCMLRTAQMMTATAIKKHLLPPNFIYNEQTSSELREYALLISIFCDYQLDACPLSIHNLLMHAGHFNKESGTWFAPSEACHLVHKCLSSSAFQNKIPHLGSAVFTDGTIFLNTLMEKFNEFQSLFLLIPIRLGLMEINHGYLPILRMWLTNRFCVGFIGGKPRKSLYFYGFQNERLLYLDPHLCQETIDPFGKLIDSRTYHCQGATSMPETELDPSLAIGLYIPRFDDLKKFWALCLQMTEDSKDYPILNFAEKEPDYTDWDCDGSDTGTEYAEDSSSEDPFIVLPDPPASEDENEGALFNRLAEMGNQIAEIVQSTTSLISETVGNAIFTNAEEEEEVEAKDDDIVSEPEEIVADRDPKSPCALESSIASESSFVQVDPLPAVVPIDAILENEG